MVGGDPCRRSLNGEEPRPVASRRPSLPPTIPSVAKHCVQSSMRPVLPASGPTAESFRLVRRHAQYLSSWLQRWPGWTLILQSDLARLRKTPSGRPDATRGVIDKGQGNERTQFSRRRYAILCLVLATLESEQRQTTLQQVAHRTELAVRTDAELQELDFEFDLKVLNHRRELVAVMRLLQRWNVLARADGDDSQFLAIRWRLSVSH